MHEFLKKKKKGKERANRTEYLLNLQSSLQGKYILCFLFISRFSFIQNY